MSKSIVSNVFKTLAFGLVLVAVAIALSACGEKDPKVEGFSVYLDGTLVSDSNKTITLDYNNTANWEEKITVKLNYSDDTQQTITKGEDGYTITGVPTTLDAGTYELTIKYGSYSGVVVDLVINEASIDMSQVAWSDTTLSYDGQEKSVELQNLPQGVTANYTGNTATDAGTYTAQATLVYDQKNYVLTNNTVELSQEWTIKKASIDMSQVAWGATTSFTYDRQEKSVELQNLPQGVTAKYTNNTATDAGNYTASVTFEYDDDNYVLANNSVEELEWRIAKSADYNVAVSVANNAEYFVGQLPTLSASGFEGSVVWDVQQTVFGEQTAYTWTFTPTNENYAPKTGSINLTQVTGYNQTFDYNVNNDWVADGVYIYKDCEFQTAISSTKKVDLTFLDCSFTTGNTGGGGDKCIYLTSFTNLVVDGCTFGGETTEGTMSTAGYALDLNIYSTTVDKITIINNTFNTTAGADTESIAISIKVRLGETDKPSDVTGTIGSIANGVEISGNTFADTCNTIYIGSGPKGSTMANVSTGAFDVQVANNKSDVYVLERYLYAEGIQVPQQLVEANATQEFGNKTLGFVANQNYSNLVDTYAEYFAQNIYNNSNVLGNSKTYTLAEVQEKFADFNYYVELGTLQNYGQVLSIGFGDLVLESDKDYYLSIGLNNFILDKLFYVEDSKLYVAFPVVGLEYVNNAEIKINQTPFATESDASIAQLNINKVQFRTGATSTITPVAGNEYDVVIKEGDKWLEIYYEGASQDDILFGKRFLNDGTPFYSISMPELIGDEYCATKYLVNYTTDPTQINDEFHEATTTHYTYVVGKGVIALKTNITLDVQSAE